MNYEQEIKNYSGTLYAQELEATKRMIYRAKWYNPGEHIPEDFFWKIFRENVLVYVGIYMDEKGATQKEMIESITSGKVEQYVDTMIDVFKKKFVEQATDEEFNRLADAYLDIRKKADEKSNKIVNDFNKWQQNDKNFSQEQQSSAIGAIILILVIVFVIIVCAIE